MAAAADGKLRWAEAIGGFSPHPLFDDAVFERMKADDDEATAIAVISSKAEQTVGLREGRFKAVEFAVDADPERKKDLGGGVSFGSASCTPHSLLDGFG